MIACPLCRNWRVLMSGVLVAVLVGVGIGRWRASSKTQPTRLLSANDRQRLKAEQEELIAEAVLRTRRDFQDVEADLHAVTAAQEKLKKAMRLGEQLGEDVSRHRKVLSNYAKMEAIIRQRAALQRDGR